MSNNPEQQPVVYVVDDDTSMRMSLKRLLTFKGFVVEEFPAALEFLDTVRSDVPACLVLDLHMPGMGGFELQERLAELDKSLPVIFITAFGTVSGGVRAMKSGACDFLEKPFDNEQLLAAIERALERGRTARTAEKKRQRAVECYDTLTAREREVFALVVQGLTNREIAECLGNTEATVKIHRGRVMDKMDAPSIVKLIMMAESIR